MNGLDFGTAIGLIKGLGSPDPAVIESAVSDWLDNHPEATTTVQDGSITKAKLDSNLQGTVDDVADLKSQVSMMSGEILTDVGDLNVRATDSNYKLLPDKKRVAAEGYSIVKYEVVPGTLVHINTDQLSQFQSNTGWIDGNNVVGYQIVGEAYVTVPQNAITLCMCKLTANTSKTTKASSAISKIEGITDQLISLTKPDSAQTLALYGAFKNGGLESGVITSITYRVVSQNIMQFARDITLNVAPGYRFGVAKYESGVYKSQTGWNTEPYEISEGTEFRIVIAKNLEQYDIADVDTFVEKITIKTAIKDVQDKIQATNNKIPLKKSWITCSHTGKSDTDLVANTVGAMWNAYQNGAQMLETDAIMASDGIIMVCHDPTITGKTAGGETVTYTIAETPSTTLKELILSESDVWGTQKMPLFSDVLDLAYHTNMILNIDIKDQSEIDTLCALVVEHGMAGRCFYGGFGTLANMQKILAADPDAKFVSTLAGYSQDMFDAVPDYKARFYCFTFTNSQADFDAIHAAGLRAFGTSIASSTNFNDRIIYHPQVMEYLPSADFRSIEENYLNGYLPY